MWEDNDDEAEARPESITVTLLRNGEAHSTYTLSDSNDWQHTFNGLSSSYTWSVAEADVPEGYLSAVTGSGSAWTITNTYEAAELDDEDTPLSPAPGEETDMPDGDVPMGDGTGLEDGTEIVDPDTPLGDLPQTGAAQAVNPLATAGFMALAASMAAAGLVLTRTKSGKREEDC